MNTITRIEIINAVAESIDAKTYLEIGVRNPADCFDRIAIPQRWGIDPRGPLTSAPREHKGTKDTQPVRAFVRETSHEFFAALTKAAHSRKRYRPAGRGTVPAPKPGQYDVIFIDGDHTYAGAVADFTLAADLLSPDGVMVAHDLLPANDNEAAPTKPNNGKPWCGEVWRAWRDKVLHRESHWRSEIANTDHGVGIARRYRDGEPMPAEPIKIESYEDLRGVSFYPGAGIAHVLKKLLRL